MTAHRPCPACGESAHVQEIDWHDDDGRWLAVECLACKVTAPAALWNDLPRVDDPDDGERL